MTADLVGFEMRLNTILKGHVLDVLKTLPDASVDCVMTSPPYYGLRNYNNCEAVWDAKEGCQHDFSVLYHKPRGGGDPTESTQVGNNRKILHFNYDSAFCSLCGAWRGQLGLEPSWKMYVQHLVQIFAEVKRVLKPSGSLWLNIGDTYFGGGHGGNTFYELPSGEKVKSVKQGRSSYYIPTIHWEDDVYKPKCLMGIPWRVAFTMIEDGWILRNAVIWYKPNHMPASIKDRLANTYEYIFHFVKSKKYHYDLDAIKLPHKSTPEEAVKKIQQSGGKSDMEASKGFAAYRKPLHPSGKNPGDVVRSKHDLAVHCVGRFSYMDPLHTKGYYEKGKNPGDFWEVNTRPYFGAHFAVFPPELCIVPILSTCPPEGVVMDIFAGSGTTLAVAKVLGRKYIGIEIVDKYISMMEERLRRLECPLMPITKRKEAEEAVERIFMGVKKNYGG